MDKEEILTRIKRFAEDFAERKLSSYVDRISRPGAIGNSAKEINDAIWGTIKLSPLEIVVIDSPLVQRLRFIRQLGVVHWVYPGATHSRFEHSLGVLHQAQQLINAINQASDAGTASAPIDGSKAALVRLCAILHDIGHGVFSHVSEHALSRRLDLKLALQSFAQANGLAKIQLSELIAFHFIGSPSFQRMLTVTFDNLKNPISVGGGSAENAKRVSGLAQKAIIGKHIDEQVPLLHEIITGPFDADKLDYYARDAKHAGVPSTLDISRLLQKITTRRVSSRDMPEDMLVALREPLDSRDLFGLKWSGTAILDELHLARVLLYAKIYRHKKVSAIESMIDALFEALGSHPDVNVIDLIALSYELYDDQLLITDAETMLRMLGASDGFPGIKASVDSIVSRLRDRDLYVSALALVPKYPADPWGDDMPQKRGLDRIASDCKNEQALAKFRRAITDELRSIHRLMPEAIGGLNPDTLEHAIVVSAKPALGGGTEIDRALILQDNHFVRGRELDRMNRTAWADAYDVGKPQAILFAPRECAAAAYVAAERYIRGEYGVVLPRTALQMSKQDANEIDQLKRGLESVGWYSGIPFDIRPLPERLLRQDVERRVEHIAVKLEMIDEPKGTLSPRRAPAMKDRIISWLAQFRDDAIITCALAALERMKLLGREQSQTALAAFAETNPEFKGSTICPLGELKDSGAIQAYLSRDIERLFPRTMTIDEAVARGGTEPIVLLDDFTGSGSQVLDILGNWFADDQLKQEQLQELRLPLGEQQRAFLRSRPVAFVFVAGWKAGLDRIREEAKRLGLEAKVFANIMDDSIPFAFEGALSDQDPESLKAFEKRCREVGEALLASNGKTQDKQRERAIGYGNRAMLLTSRFNVPTQTLTCFWMDGKHSGVEWHALIRRRPKG
jgi:HD superfamily phosphohydrolase